MKLAFITSDRSSLKTLPLLQKYYSDVHFYFGNSKTAGVDLEAEKLPMLVDGVHVSPDPAMRTPHQELVFKNNSQNYKNFFNQIYPTKVSAEIEDTNSSLHEFQESGISEINFIKYNRELGKYAIENSRLEITEYDFLLIQNSQAIMAEVLEKQQNLFNSFTEQTKSIITLVFNLKHFHKTGTPNNFIFVENSMLDSVQDNWYLVKLNADTAEISFYIPYEMQESEDYRLFLSQRVLSAFNRRFVAFQLEEFIGSYVTPADGYYSYKAKLRHSKGGALVPTYNLWTTEKMTAHLSQLLKNRPTNKKEILENGR
jgi:hypothetical protein